MTAEAQYGAPAKGWGRFQYSKAELVADAVVHAVGLVAAITAGAILLALAAYRTGPWEYGALLFYVVSLVTVLSISLAYNMWPVSRAKWILRRFDHAAIFLLIAGTYTPLLTQLPDPGVRITMAAVIWSCAVLGIAIKLLLPGRFERLSVVFYLAMAWSGVFAAETLLTTLPSTTLWLVAAGGIAYSSGVVFYVWQSLRFHAAAWHVFVVTGAGLHLAAMMHCMVIARA